MPLRFAFRMVRTLTFGLLSPVSCKSAVTRRRACAAAVSMPGRIFLTVIGMRRRHAQAGYQTGPEGSGAGRGALPEPAPRAGARSGVLVQRFLRRPRRGAGEVRDGAAGESRGAPVTEAAAAFGYSRPAYYQAAAALGSSGLEGLVPARPGPRGGHKLTEQILAWAEDQLAAAPERRPAQLTGQIEESFGVRVHPRTIEKALARRRERHSKSR